MRVLAFRKEFQFRKFFFEKREFQLREFLLSKERERENLDKESFIPKCAFIKVPTYFHLIERKKSTENLRRKLYRKTIKTPSLQINFLHFYSTIIMIAQTNK